MGSERVVGMKLDGLRTILCTIGTRPEAIKMAPGDPGVPVGALGAVPGPVHGAASRARRRDAGLLRDRARPRSRHHAAEPDPGGADGPAVAGRPRRHRPGAARDRPGPGGHHDRARDGDGQFLPQGPLRPRRSGAADAPALRPVPGGGQPGPCGAPECAPFRPDRFVSREPDPGGNRRRHDPRSPATR